MNIYNKKINCFAGRGTFATKFYRKGSFLLEYRGEIIDYTEALKREKRYSKSLGSFLFFFKKSGGKTYW